MKVYTFSEAREKLASVLDNAQREGSVRIKRRDGRVFAVEPVREATSPLAVKGVRLELTRDEIVGAVREGREIRRMRGFLKGLKTDVRRGRV